VLFFLSSNHSPSIFENVYFFKFEVSFFYFGQTRLFFAQFLTLVALSLSLSYVQEMKGMGGGGTLRGVGASRGLAG
jgi:hypothetical protein